MSDPCVLHRFSEIAEETDWSERPQTMETETCVHECLYREDGRGRYVIITCHTPAGLYGNLTDWSSVRGGTWGGFGGFRYYYEEER